MKSKEKPIEEQIVVHLVDHWVHTHGMNALGLPELEMKNIPLFLLADAGRLINHIATYIHHNKKGPKKVQLGETFSTGKYCVVTFIKATPTLGEEDYYKDEVWEVVAEVSYYKNRACECCKTAQ